ncbi:hypothetical protein M8C21_003300, partial [Ambrosia artemisiifolia]
MRETIASSSSLLSTSSSGTPPVEAAWINTYDRLSPPWQSSALSPHSAIPIAISRVNQVDAGRLDIEMSAMLKEQMVKVFSVMKETKNKMHMYIAETVEIAPEMKNNGEEDGTLITERVVSEDKDCQTGRVAAAVKREETLARRAWLIVQRIEGLYKAASFTNLLVFLFTGRYRNLIERALQARLVYGSPHMNRAEMLLLLLPLLNSSSMKSFLSPFSKDKSSGSSGDETLCPICQTNPTTVYLALPCQH